MISIIYKDNSNITYKTFKDIIYNDLVIQINCMSNN